MCTPKHQRVSTRSELVIQSEIVPIRQSIALRGACAVDPAVLDAVRRYSLCSTATDELSEALKPLIGPESTSSRWLAGKADRLGCRGARSRRRGQADSRDPHDPMGHFCPDGSPGVLARGERVRPPTSTAVSRRTRLQGSDANRHRLGGIQERERRTSRRLVPPPGHVRQPVGWLPYCRATRRPVGRVGHGGGRCGPADPIVVSHLSRQHAPFQSERLHRNSGGEPAGPPS